MQSLLQCTKRECKSLPFTAVAGEEFSLVVVIAGRCDFQRSLRSGITGSGHLHHLRRVFSLSVKLLLTLKEPQDVSIMEAILDVMGFERYRDAAEWLMNTLERPPKLCYTIVGSTANGGLWRSTKWSLQFVPDVSCVHIAGRVCEFVVRDLLVRKFNRIFNLLTLTIFFFSFLDFY